MFILSVYAWKFQEPLFEQIKKADVIAIVSVERINRANDMVIVELTKKINEEYFKFYVNASITKKNYLLKGGGKKNILSFYYLVSGSYYKKLKLKSKYLVFLKRDKNGNLKLSGPNLIGIYDLSKPYLEVMMECCNDTGKDKIQATTLSVTPGFLVARTRYIIWCISHSVAAGKIMVYEKKIYSKQFQKFSMIYIPVLGQSPGGKGFKF